MKNFAHFFFLFIPFFYSTFCLAFEAGVGKEIITPTLDINAAGYETRIGQPMQGVHDQLYATTLMLKVEDQLIAFCSIDNLGFTFELYQKICQKIKQHKDLEKCHIYLGSTHTHSGGGGFLNIPLVGEKIAGPYCEKTTDFYIHQIVESIVQAYKTLKPAKMGFGYGKAEGLSHYRAKWPLDVIPNDQLSVIKVTDLTGNSLAVLFNYALHPTVLGKDNKLFSADFVHSVRTYLARKIGENTAFLYFNGAQAELLPHLPNGGDRFAFCEQIGTKLGSEIYNIWNQIELQTELNYKSLKKTYSFVPKATPQGLKLPLEQYHSEINLLVFNNREAILTVPGELSCLYEDHFKALIQQTPLKNLSIWGLTNDAHGYILTPEAYRKKTLETYLSFGGEEYGERVYQMFQELIHQYLEDNN